MLIPHIFLIGLACFCYRRLLRYLRFFQQEGYDPKRFLDWVWRSRAWDRRGTLLLLATAWVPGGEFAAGVGFTGLALLEKDPRKDGKLPLKMTARLRRIEVTSLLLTILLIGISAAFPMLWAIVVVQLLPFVVPLAGLLLGSDEKRRQRQFMDEAKARWAEVAPYTIGITGSYGKTSMKHACGHLLQNCLGTTFWPDAGINTIMGHTREIRTRLRNGTAYAVMEMGAYGRGSIRRLCDFTPPQAAVVTAVGTCHLERFGDRETIYQAKSELAQALPKDGLLVCNGDNDGARRMAGEFPAKRTLLYGLDPTKGKLDCRASDWVLSEAGTRFQLHWEGESYRAEIPLLGVIHLSNCLGAFTLACALGASPDYAIAAMRHLKPVKNRLQPEKVDGSLFLHDAYNSNPQGFGAALDVMEALPAKRRILVTPGMIELGEEQADDNRRLAQRAAGICDIVLPVGPTNRLALLKGFEEGGLAQDKIVSCDSRDEALVRIREMRQPGDVILIENDLPDLYEHAERY